MTAEDREIFERLTRLETRADGQEKWLESIDKKVDRILSYIDMGRGGWLALAKAGGIAALVIAAAWAVLDKLIHYFGK